MIPVETLVRIVALFLFAIFWITAFTILYHLVRFGVGVLPKKLAAVFLLGALALFTWSVVLFANLDLSNIRL